VAGGFRTQARSLRVLPSHKREIRFSQQGTCNTTPWIINHQFIIPHKRTLPAYI
jgi:hypothetical protein